MFINYLKFIYDGKYMNLWQVFFKTDSIFNKVQFMNRTNEEESILSLTAREELWLSYFSLFKLVKEFSYLMRDSAAVQLVLNRLAFIRNKMLKAITNRSPVIQNNSDIDSITICALCEQKPTMPYRSVANEKSDLSICKHIFCYNCIISKLNYFDKIRSEFTCPRCQIVISEVELFFLNSNFN
jgi:hypothetical protein